MSLNPISFQDIVLYAMVYDIDDFQVFCHYIQLLDDEFLRYHGEKLKRKSTSK